MPDGQSRQYFQTWYQTGLGHSLLQSELAAIASELDSVVGYYLVTQSPLKNMSLDNHRVRNSLLIAPSLELGASDRTIVAKASELPFESDGIEVHVFHHTLDVSATPHDDLREATRTLLPSGKMIIIGFNPWSLWGFFRLFSNSSKAPWCGRFISHQRIEDWLKVAGLTLDSKRFIYYEPPVQNTRWRLRFAWLERILKPLKLPCSGVYMMTATKQVKRYTPLKPRWTRTRVRVPPLTKPTVKEIIK